MYYVAAGREDNVTAKATWNDRSDGVAVIFARDRDFNMRGGTGRVVVRGRRGGASRRRPKRIPATKIRNDMDEQYNWNRFTFRRDEEIAISKIVMRYNLSIFKLTERNIIYWKVESVVRRFFKIYNHASSTPDCENGFSYLNVYLSLSKGLVQSWWNF